MVARKNLCMLPCIFHRTRCLLFWGPARANAVSDVYIPVHKLEQYAFTCDTYTYDTTYQVLRISYYYAHTSIHAHAHTGGSPLHVTCSDSPHTPSLPRISLTPVDSVGPKVYVCECWFVPVCSSSAVCWAAAGWG